MTHSKWIPRLCALCIAVPALRAQETAEQPDDSAPQRHYVEVHAALDSWKAEHGDAWELVYDKQTGAGRFLFGGSSEASFAPRNDADYFTLARRALEQTFAIHRIDASTLIDDEVMFLPLGNAGTTDKMTVQFRQVVAGVPVMHGFANVLFDTHGTLLSVDTTALPELARFGASPAITAERAAQIAVEMFARDPGFAPTFIGAPELAIEQAVQGKFRNPVLVWRVNVQSEREGGEAAGFEYRIDAASGALSSRVTSIHSVDVSGTVTSFSSPGNQPNVASNPAQALAMPNMTVSSPSGNTTTDVNGNFNIVGASAPLAVTVRYIGPWANVINDPGAAYTLSPTLGAGSGNAVVMNPTPTGPIVAQSNAFLAINMQREWTRSVNPADAKHDFLATARVNIAATCNAFYDGAATNFYNAGNGCVNTAYSTIVMHEMGHWMNDRYGSGNDGTGFGEGNADNFATYLTDDPVVGRGFQGTGTYIRTGLNTRQFCGDTSLGCYGEPHNDGEVLMGAIWKVRARLKTALGASAGVVAANTLFNSWMNAYNDGLIQTIIETHWLTLDDNDGNIANGTPHHANIDGGFRDQGFPGHTITAYVSITNVTQLADTQDQFGPYVVDASISPLQNPPLASATLFYRLGNGAFTSLPMSLVSGTTYRASIPGQGCLTDVDYYVVGVDNAGNSNSYPIGAPTNYLDFTVGNITPVYSSNFESGTAGWTHAMIATQDDWQLSSAQGLTISGGLSGDPSIPAISGANIWGNDLGPSGYDGLYKANVSNYLRSPVIDCTNATNTRLRFKRWLQVEQSPFDQAQVKVNGSVVWTNPTSGDLLDAAWTPVELDISALADGHSSVQIEFSLVTDGTLQYGGWNIDDFEVVSIGSCSSCAAPVPYCTNKITSQLTEPIIASSGNPTLTDNDFSVTLSAALPNKQAVCFWGTAPTASPFHGGTLCVHQPVHRLVATQTNASSAASIAIPVDASMPGTQRRYQWWFRDPADAQTIGLSGGLLVTFCQ